LLLVVMSFSFPGLDKVWCFIYNPAGGGMTTFLKAVKCQVIIISELLV